jgi:LysR family transcriptional activator of nhaA
MRERHFVKDEPMKPAYSYHHLHYFWIVAREGGMARAAERLGMAVQTVSTQVRQLERDLGQALFRPEGRSLALTPAGEAALRQADEIFQLGEALPQAVRDAAQGVVVRLAVGLSEALPKLAVRRLLQPVLHEPRLRLVCREGGMDELLAQLALHRLDVLIVDRPPAPNRSLRLHTHPLGASPLAWYAVPRLQRRAARAFPASLGQVPLLLPAEHWAIRADLDRWLAAHGIVPSVAGEFDDSALLKAFAAEGMGAIAAAESLGRDLRRRYGLGRIGPCEGIEERFFAIAAERKVRHPLLARLLPR